MTYLSQNKKGSIALAVVAAGVVSATILTMHSVVQNFESGAGQLIGRHEAHYNAKKILTLASMMVSDNVVLCSPYLPSPTPPSTPPEPPPGGCKLLETDMTNPAWIFFRSLNESKSNFMPIENTPANYEDLYSLPSTGVEPDRRFVLRYKNLSSSRNSLLRSASKITWSLKNRTDPQWASALGGSAISSGVMCMDAVGNPREGFCPALSSSKNLDEAKRTAPKCKVSDSLTAADIPESRCDYFATTDSDSAFVLVRVEIPYQDTSEGAGSTKLVVNVAVKRPPSFFSISKVDPKDYSRILNDLPDGQREDYKPVTCDFTCEKTKIPSFLGAEANLCAGLNIDSTRKYRVPLKIKNHGPGTLYNVRLRREDITNDSNRVLSQSLVDVESSLLPGGSFPLAPGQTLVFKDEVPCYAAPEFKPNIRLANYTCRRSESVQSSATIPVVKISEDFSRGTQDKRNHNSLGSLKATRFSIIGKRPFLPTSDEEQFLLNRQVIFSSSISSLEGGSSTLYKCDYGNRFSSTGASPKPITGSAAVVCEEGVSTDGLKYITSSTCE